MIEINNIKVGDIIHYFSLSKIAGRIWSLSYSRVKIKKINNKTIKIDKIDDNDGSGNEWNIDKTELASNHNYYYTFEEALKDIKFLLKEWSKKAKEQLNQYTNKHPNYDWYVYTANVLNDFYNLVKKGYTREKYLELKNKYKHFEKETLKTIYR